MWDLQSVVKNDTSSITVNFKSYDSTGIWVSRTIKFNNEEKAYQYIQQIKKDFTKRLVDVERRTIVYEKFTSY